MLPQGCCCKTKIQRRKSSLITLSVFLTPSGVVPTPTEASSTDRYARGRSANLPFQRSCGPSSEVKVLLSGLVLAVSAFQSVEDDRGQDGKCAEDEESLVEAANHLA